MNFDVNNLINKCSAFENKGQKGGEFAKTAFLPEGKHRGRVLVDTNGEVFTSYYAYGYFNKGIRDPRGLQAHELPEGFKDELATVAQTLADRGKWKFKAKEVFIVPFYLEWTDRTSENWEPGNLYYVIGNKKFSSSLVKFLGSVAKENPQEIQKLLDPNQDSYQLEVQITGGQGGGCNIGVAFPQKVSPAIDLTKHVYVSVEEAYIRKGFNLEKYNALLQQAKEELEITPEKKEGAEVTKPEFNAQPTQPTVSEPVQTETVQQPVQETVAQPTSNPSNPWEKFKTQA